MNFLDLSQLEGWALRGMGTAVDRDRVRARVRARDRVGVRGWGWGGRLLSCRVCAEPCCMVPLPRQCTVACRLQGGFGVSIHAWQYCFPVMVRLLSGSERMTVASPAKSKVT